MMADVELKTFEFGMLRALGFSSGNLAVTIFMQSFLIGVPATSAALVLSSALNAGVRHIFYLVIKNHSHYRLTGSAIAIGVAFGLTIPLVANIFPIRRALAKNLRNSLDISHKHIGEITILISRLKELGLSLEQFVLAICLVFFGILTYYAAPHAYMYSNIDLFFLILNTLLLAMIIGLIFLFQLIQPIIQRAVVFIMLNTCCRRDKRLNSLILQNIASHRRRNFKTALMFTFCICFIMYAGCTFRLSENLVLGLVEQSIGADLMASVPTDILG